MAFMAKDDAEAAKFPDLLYSPGSPLTGRLAEGRARGGETSHVNSMKSSSDAVKMRLPSGENTALLIRPA